MPIQQNHHFDFIWETFIEPILCKAESTADSNFKEECNLKCCNLKSYKTKLEKIYRRKREWLKEIYLPNKAEPLLDMHKVGAIICRAIIGEKPFSFNIEKANDYITENNIQKDNIEWYVNNVYINYKIAFYASAGFVYAEILKKLQDVKDIEGNEDLNNKFETITNRGVLNFYPKSPNHEDFETSVIISLMKNDIANRDFDYLTYAIMLFQLERYNYIKDNIDLYRIFPNDKTSQIRF